MTRWDYGVHEEIRKWHDIWYASMNDSTSTQQHEKCSEQFFLINWKKIISFKVIW